jgi:hypothetical protein
VVSRHCGRYAKTVNPLWAYVVSAWVRAAVAMRSWRGCATRCSNAGGHRQQRLHRVVVDYVDKPGSQSCAVAECPQRRRRPKRAYVEGMA